MCNTSLDTYKNLPFLKPKNVKKPIHGYILINILMIIFPSMVLQHVTKHPKF
jgi:hypothetical protein